MRLGGLPGGALVEAALGKGGYSLWVILQGTPESRPPPRQLWPTYRPSVSGGSSERLLGFQPGVCDSGIVGGPGGKVGGLAASRAPAPRLPWVISGLGQAGKVRSCVISSTSLRR